MATADQSTTHQKVAERFDESTAELLGDFIDERAQAVFERYRQQMTDMVRRQQANIEADKEAGSKNARDTNRVTGEIQAADEARLTAEADPSPENIAIMQKRFEQVSASLDDVKRRVVELRFTQNQLERDRKDISPLMAGGVLFVASFIVLLIAALFSSLTIWEASWFSLLGGLITLLAATAFNRLTTPKSDKTKQEQNKKFWSRKTKRTEDEHEDAGTGIFDDNEERDRQPVGAH